MSLGRGGERIKKRGSPPKKVLKKDAGNRSETVRVVQKSVRRGLTGLARNVNGILLILQ